MFWIRTSGIVGLNCALESLPIGKATPSKCISISGFLQKIHIKLFSRVLRRRSETKFKCHQNFFTTFSKSSQDYILSFCQKSETSLSLFVRVCGKKIWFLLVGGDSGQLWFRWDEERWYWRQRGVACRVALLELGVWIQQPLSEYHKKIWNKYYNLRLFIQASWLLTRVLNSRFCNVYKLDNELA